MSIYGFCPTCSAPGATRARNPVGPTVCENGHQHNHDKFTQSPNKTSKEAFIELMQHHQRDVNELAGGVFANPITRDMWDIWNKATEFAGK